MATLPPITVEQLGKMLYEEFEKDAWGDVTPYYFKYVPKSTNEGEMAGLYEVVERVVKRINEHFGV